MTAATATAMASIVRARIGAGMVMLRKASMATSSDLHRRRYRVSL